VQRGDTLYSIAFRYGLDFRKLAAANDIAPPYTIYPGQRLALSGAAPPPPTAGGARAEATPDAGPAAAPAPAPPATAVSPAPSPTAVSPAPSPAARVYRGRPVERWRWPSSGRVLRGFSASVHKGIDLDGRRGDPVHAAGDGVVVYAGTGIVGLGELLIIKHNEEYLSAYGHNEQLLVAEGTVVTAGQRIAEKGGSGTDRVKLHFEIRRAGKPVDPLRLLPPR